MDSSRPSGATQSACAWPPPRWKISGRVRATAPSFWSPAMQPWRGAGPDVSRSLGQSGGARFRNWRSRCCRLHRSRLSSRLAARLGDSRGNIRPIGRNTSISGAAGLDRRALRSRCRGRGWGTAGVAPASWAVTLACATGWRFASPHGLPQGLREGQACRRPKSADVRSKVREGQVASPALAKGPVRASPTRRLVAPPSQPICEMPWSFAGLGRPGGLTQAAFAWPGLWSVGAGPQRSAPCAENRGTSWWCGALAYAPARQKT